MKANMIEVITKAEADPPVVAELFPLRKERMTLIISRKRCKLINWLKVGSSTSILML